MRDIAIMSFNPLTDRRKARPLTIRGLKFTPSSKFWMYVYSRIKNYTFEDNGVLKRKNKVDFYLSDNYLFRKGCQNICDLFDFCLSENSKLAKGKFKVTDGRE